MDTLFYRDLAIAMQSGKVIIAGCGYVGKKLASALKSAGCHVIALVRTDESREKLQREYESYALDLDSDARLPQLDSANSILFYFIPPPSQGTNDNRLARFLSLIDSRQAPRKIILISTTGVYGNCGADWVDETREPAPDTDRARRRLHAEQLLTEWCKQHRIDYIILRVPGIYGPDKLPIKRLQEQKPVLNLSESPWSNRIHINDLVQTCIRAIDYNGEYKIFNVSDGHPSSMTDFFLSVADALGLPQPEQISLDQCKQVFSQNMLSYLIESKKICNDRLLNEFGIKLQYPNLQQGLSGLE